MKKPYPFILPVLAAFLIFALMIWAIFQHGTLGFLRVTNLALYGFILLGVIGLVFIGAALLYGRLRNRPNGRGAKPLAISLTAVSAFFLILFTVLWVVLAGFPSAGVEQHVPQRMLHLTEEGSVHFAVGSDAHFRAGTNNLAATGKMLAQIASPANRYDIFFFLGDLVEYGFLDSQWKQATEAFTPAASALPVRFAPGNHDTLFAGLRHYVDYCAPSVLGSIDDTRLWYRLDAGRVHFLVLDIEWSAESYTASQAAWLEEQLGSIPAGDWKVVLSHGFYYASGINSQGWKWYDNPETISRLTPLFEKYGVDLVFSGHDHDLEVLQHSGVTYVVCGAFGGLPDESRTYTSPASLWYQAGQPGFVDATIAGDQAKLIIRSPEAGTIQSFTFPKRR